MARLEDLLERRPELLSSVKLRQNPHNVHEWLQRAKLYRETPEKVIRCFTEAVMTVDPQKAEGRVRPGVGQGVRRCMFVPFGGLSFACFRPFSGPLVLRRGL